jgi:hypothetical protein
MTVGTEAGQAAPEVPETALKDGETTQTTTTDEGAAAGADSAEKSDEVEDGEQTGKLSPAAQAAVDKRIGKIVAKQKAAEERVSAVEQERDALKAEVEQTRSMVSDKAVLAAAEAAGVLPKYLTKDDAEMFKAADKLTLERNYWRDRAREGGCTIGGKEYTADDCKDFAEQKNDSLADLTPDVKARRREIAKTIRSRLELGDAAYAAKWVPGAAKPAQATTTATAAGGKPPAKPDDPTPTRQPPPTPEFDKVASTDDLAEAIYRQKRGKAK